MISIAGIKRKLILIHKDVNFKLTSFGMLESAGDKLWLMTEDFSILMEMSLNSKEQSNLFFS